MAQIDVVIANRRYAIACKNGEEEHLLRLAAMIDRQAGQAAEALGTMPENRQLLMAALLIADELVEARGATAPLPQPAAAPEPGPPRPDPAIDRAVGALADRIDALCEALEKRLASA